MMFSSQCCDTRYNADNVHSSYVGAPIRRRDFQTQYVLARALRSLLWM